MAKNILVVDDDEITLKLAYFTLKRNENYSIQLANSGMDAYDKMQRAKFDLVLLDIEMPVLSGIKTFEMFKKNPAMADIPVIFLTAVTDTKSILDVVYMGAVDYVKKPFKPDDLLSRVEKVLGE